MNRLKQFWKREGVRVYSASGDWLAILRIGTGITIMAKILSEYGAIGLLYGSSGIVPAEVSALFRHGVTPTFILLSHHVAAIWPEAAFLRICFDCYFVFALLLTVGLFSRVSAIVCWFFQLTLLNSSFLTCYGFEYLTQSLLFYSIIFPVGRYCSLDNLIWKRQRKHDPYLPIYHFFFQVHLCLIYFVTGVAKELLPSWHDGSYIWNVTSHAQFVNAYTELVRAILACGPGAFLMGWFVIALEIIYPIGIWFRRLARPFFIFIILLHIYIAAAVGLWLFGWIMIVFNMAAFGDVLIRQPVLSHEAHEEH